MDAAPFPKGGGTVLLRYDCWNFCVTSFGEPSRERGGSVGNRLEGPPHPELQWIPGLSHTSVCSAVEAGGCYCSCCRFLSLPALLINRMKGRAESTVVKCSSARAVPTKASRFG